MAYDIQPRQNTLGVERFVNAPNQSKSFIQEDYGQVQQNLSHARKPMSYSQLHNTRQQSALDVAGDIGRKALDFLILDDIRTIQDPKAPLWSKGLALASFFPVAK